MNIPHHEGRRILEQAFADTVGREPSLPELQTLTALTGLESGYYGNGWKTERGKRSNNWGAIVDINRLRPPCTETGFANQDSSPSPGGDVGEQRCFRMYGSPLDGARALIQNTLLSSVKGRGPKASAAAAAGDLTAFSQALYDSGYFQGVAKHSPGERVRHYARALLRHARQASAALDEPLAVKADGNTAAALGLGVSLAFGLLLLSGAKETRS